MIPSGRTPPSGPPTGVAALALLAAPFVLFGFARAALRAAGGEWGLPLDDAWIHQRFAAQLAAGQGWSFNSGEPSAASTSPLWVVLLALLRLGGADGPGAAMILSGIGFGLTAALAGWLAGRLAGGWAAVLAAGLTLLTGRFAWAALSGMEITAFGAVSLLTLVVLDRDGSGPVLGALLGLGILLRPEGWLLALIVVALTAGSRALPRRQLLALAMTGAVIVAPWVIWCLALTGTPLPATFGPNGGGLRWPDTGFLRAWVRLLTEDNLPLLLAAALGSGLIIGVGRVRSRAGLALASWWILLPLASSIVAPNLRHYGRYLMPILPAGAVLAAGAAVRVAAALGTRGGRPGRVLGLLATAGVLATPAALALPTWVETFGHNVGDIQGQHVRTARWLAEHAGLDCLLATNDIGVLGVLSGCRIYDLVGLVTPEMARLHREVTDPTRRAELIHARLRERGVTHVAIHPAWFPDLARDGTLVPVFEARLADNRTTAGARFVVYRTPWGGRGRMPD